MSIPNNITEEHIKKAIEKIDSSGSEELRSATKFEILYKGKCYPPKEIIRLANEIANGYELINFSGGDESNNFLIRRGFTILLKDTEEIIGLNYTKNKNENVIKFVGKGKIFRTTDEANWAFECIHNMVTKLGISEPGDERLAVTCRKDRNAIHINYCSWLMIGFFYDQERGNCILMPFTEADNLKDYEINYTFKKQGMNRKINAYILPIKDVMSLPLHLKENYEETLQYAREVFQQQKRSPYRIHNHSKLELAVFNHGVREEIFSEGIESQNVTMVNTEIRTKFLYIMNNYLDVKKESFGGNEMGRIVRNDAPQEFNKLPYITEDYVVNGSVGQGNWATVPWIAIMNKKITTSTQRGYYIVYLFSEDMQRLYLTLAQGVTETSREEMEENKRNIRENIEMIPKVKKDDNIYLGDSKRARDYVFSTAAYIEYPLENMPSEEELTYDLKEVVSYYEQYIALEGSETMPVDPEADKVSEKPRRTLSMKETVEHIHAYISSKGFYYEKEEVTNLFLSLKTKPFVILSGISGTGKTRIVKLFAEAVGATQVNGQFNLIPVRPDWSDGSDLLGYTDIKGDFQEGSLTTVLKNAMDNPDRPYFALLDEMNLARVEHYFSDFLSVMEDRDWKNGNLVTSTVITDNDGREIYLPSNVYIIGTVNMDETTHPFSKKVLDRANTIEFNRVKLDHLVFLKDLPQHEPIPLENDVFETKYLYLKDLYRINQDIVKKVTDELVKINEALKIMQAHIGYRVRDEISFYLAYNDMGELIPFEQALDNCILQKILPRIAGSDARVDRMLRELYKVFTNKDLGPDEEFTDTDLAFAKYPKSAEKVVEMLRRLEEDGFTSFWISS